MRTILETYEKQLKQEDVKIVELESEDADHEDYPFLSEDLTEQAREKLKKVKGLKRYEDLKLYYSLSYSQGDGLMFEGHFEYNGTIFNIKHDGLCYHSKSIKTELISHKGKYYECNEMTDKQEEQAFKNINSFCDNEYQDICKTIKKIGYESIEYTNEENILRAGFRRFLETNNIESNLELYDFDYQKKAEKGFTQVAEQGKSYIEGLWVKLPKVKYTRVLNMDEEIEKELI